MVKLNNRKIFKTVSVIAMATVFSNVSNAWFWDSEPEPRAMRMTPSGTEVPAVKESWISRATTYHEELKPSYDPKTQRVVMPTSKIYQGGELNERSSTVKPAWYDSATTYNTEQRRPWNPYDTEEKKIPAYMYYDKKEAKAWNEHYGQKGLEPVPYMYGSASLVLRKERQVADFNLIEDANLDGIKNIGKHPADLGTQDARAVGAGNIYIRPAGGFETLEKRDAYNQVASNRGGFISLSDPIEKSQDVQNYNNVMIGNPKKSDVQAATKIDQPVTDWRDKLNHKTIMTRPGDFDYEKQQEPVKAYVNEQRYAAANQGNYGQGQVIAGAGAVDSNATMDGYDYNPYANNPYANGTEKVNNYTVENGDTLSEISDKEKIYGDWTLWPLIYDANRQQINDPDLINPGQNLDIPRSYEQAQEDDARYRAKNREMPISLYDGR